MCACMILLNALWLKIDLFPLEICYKRRTGVMILDNPVTILFIYI